MERDKTKLVEALRKDYKQLYVKEYTTGWREQRLMRNIELGIMSLKNTEEYIDQELDKAREEGYETRVKDGMMGMIFEEREIAKEVEDIFNQEIKNGNIVILKKSDWFKKLSDKLNTKKKMKSKIEKKEILDGIREPIANIILSIFRDDVDGDKAVEDLIDFISQELDKAREEGIRFGRQMEKRKIFNNTVRTI